jgi:hypothetical protein
MQFIFRGQFSKGQDSQTSMGVTFRGREPSEVTDAPAIAWLDGHPEYERVPEPVVEEPVRPKIVAAAHTRKPAKSAKKSAKKPAKAKAKK